MTLFSGKILTWFDAQLDQILNNLGRYLFQLSSTYIFSSQLIKHLIYKIFLFRVEILTAILEAQKQRVSRQGIDIDKLKHQHLSGKVRREIATKIVQSSKMSSMTSLITHNVAHSTRHSFRPKTNNLKKFLSLVFN